MKWSIYKNFDHLMDSGILPKFMCPTYKVGEKIKVVSLVF